MPSCVCVFITAVPITLLQSCSPSSFELHRQFIFRDVAAVTRRVEKERKEEEGEKREEKGQTSGRGEGRGGRKGGFTLSPRETKARERGV